MKMYLNRRFTMKVLLGVVVVACTLPVQVKAQSDSIASFVDCVNTKLAAGATTADAAKTCVPGRAAGCFFTNTMSRESAQPACTLRDGTQLPRVIFSCPGPNGDAVLRFRPSFSLCTLGGTDAVIDHVELGQDVRKNNTDDPGFRGFGIQVMADVHMTGGPYSLAGALDTPAPGGSKGCADCHDKFRTTQVASASGPITANTFAPVPPELAEGTLSSDDPFVQATSGADLTGICAAITTSFNSSTGQLHKSPKGQLAVDLCNALNNLEK